MRLEGVVSSLAPYFAAVDSVFGIAAFVYAKLAKQQPPKTKGSVYGFMRHPLDRYRIAELEYHIIGAIVAMLLFNGYVTYLAIALPSRAPDNLTLTAIAVLFGVFMWYALRCLPPVGKIRKFIFELGSRRKVLGGYPLPCVLITYATLSMMVAATGFASSPFLLMLTVSVFATLFVLEKGQHVWALLTFGLCSSVVLSPAIVTISPERSAAGSPLTVPGLAVQLITVVMYALIFYRLGRSAQTSLDANRRDLHLDSSSIMIPMLHICRVFGFNDPAAGHNFMHEVRSAIVDAGKRQRFFRPGDQIDVTEDEVYSVRGTLRRAIRTQEDENEQKEHLRLQLLYRLWGTIPVSIAEPEVYGQLRRLHVEYILGYLMESGHIKSFCAVPEGTSLGREAFAINFVPDNDTESEYRSSHVCFLPYCIASMHCPSVRRNPRGPLFECDTQCSVRDCPVPYLAGRLNRGGKTFVVIRDEAVDTYLNQFVSGGGHYVYFVCCPPNLFKIAPLLKRFSETKFIFHPLTDGFRDCIYAKSKDAGSLGKSRLDLEGIREGVLTQG